MITDDFEESSRSKRSSRFATARAPSDVQTGSEVETASELRSETGPSKMSEVSSHLHQSRSSARQRSKADRSESIRESIRGSGAASSSSSRSRRRDDVSDASRHSAAPVSDPETVSRSAATASSDRASGRQSVKNYSYPKKKPLTPAAPSVGRLALQPSSAR